MKKISEKYQSDDGRIFDCKKKCMHWEKLVNLVEKEVAYQDRKDTVLQFIQENEEALKKLLN